MGILLSSVWYLGECRPYQGATVRTMRIHVILSDNVVRAGSGTRTLLCRTLTLLYKESKLSKLPTT